MNVLNSYEQMKLTKHLLKHPWTRTLNVNQRDATFGGLWLSITDGVSKLTKHDPTLKYWLIGANGFLKEQPHYHGMIYYTNLGIREINKCFKQCNAPEMKSICDLDRWIDYVLKQGLQDTIITNIGE